MKRQRLLVLSGGIVLAATLLAACTLPISGGIIGGLLVALLTGGLLFGAGFGSSGCSDDDTTLVNGCLSVTSDVGPDGDVDMGVCLQPGDIGPCLSQVPDGDIGPCLDVVPDGGEDIGVCLQPPPPDGHIGPCLDPLPPDAGDIGPCLKVNPDFGPCLSVDPDAGPCLTAPPCLSIAPDSGQDTASLLPDATRRQNQQVEDRQRVVERLATEEALPEAVIERLRQRVTRRS